MVTHLDPPSGRIEGPLHLFPVRAYFEDTDLSGVVYHANYLKWFERARSDLLRVLGVDQRAAQEAGEGVYAVADLAIRYFAPARLDDAITVRSRALELGAASVRLLQQAWREDLLLAEMNVRVGFITPEGRPRRQPQAWREAFSPLLADEGAA